MQTFASLFVSLITFANTVVPQANLPKILGVEADSTVSATVRTIVPTATTNIQNLSKERDALKARLTILKDEKKRQTVENLNDKLGQRQQKWCEHWKDVATRLDAILVKIKTRRDKAQAAGKDVTAVNLAITNAETAVAAAKSTGDAQCAKTYSIPVSTEQGIGQDVRTTVQQFSTDTKAVRDTMQAARDAIKKAIDALKGTE